MGLSGSESSGSSSGSSYGYNQSLAQSLSQSLGQSSGQSSQAVWGPQGDAMSKMYGQASALAGQQQGQVPGAAAAQGAAVQPGAQFGLDQMMQFANPNSDLARRQTADLADTVGTEFNRTVMPGINSAAGLGGNIGGSRAALAQGVAAGDAAKAISSGATDFFTNAYNQAGTAAGALPGMASSVFNLGMQPFQAAWAPLSSLAGILGGPTVLGQSTNQATNQSASRSLAQSQAENASWQKAQNSGWQGGFNLW